MASMVAGLLPTRSASRVGVEGESLADRLRRDGRLPLAEALAIARGIASVLAAAHSRGVAHVGLDPRAVFLVKDSAQIEVLDFGITRLDHDPRGDLYALGGILFEMIEGRPARTGAALCEITAPPPVRALVASLLTREPRRCPSSAAVLAVEIDRVIGEMLEIDRVIGELDDAVPLERVYEQTWKIRIGLTPDWMIVLAGFLVTCAFLAALFATRWCLT